jgi:RNA polymerase sigma-70 factor (sigma-E family)
VEVSCVPDVVSFDAFYGATRRRMVAYAFALTGDAGEAQDAVQEAYARAWERWRTVSCLDDREAWVRTVVWRIAANRWRHLAAGARAAERLGPTVTELVDTSWERVSLVAALQQIPDTQRRAIALRYLYDLSVAEVADEIGVPVGTVKSRLSRGLHALSELLVDPVLADLDAQPGADQPLANQPGDFGRAHHGAPEADHA